MQRQTAVTAYLKSKQLLLFVFLCPVGLPSSAGNILMSNSATQWQTAVSVHLKSKSLLMHVCIVEFFL